MRRSVRDGARQQHHNADERKAEPRLLRPRLWISLLIHWRVGSIDGRAVHQESPAALPTPGVGSGIFHALSNRDRQAPQEPLGEFLTRFAVGAGMRRTRLSTRGDQRRQNARHRGRTRFILQSMSADRGRPALPKAAGEPSVPLKAAGETLVAGIRRDYQTLRDHLKKKDRPRLRGDEPDALAKEARTHYWVQWFKQDKWLDLDPSFAGAVPGQAYAAAEETVNALPEAVFHRITFRIQLEEYSLLGQGRGKSKPASREILSVAHKANLKREVVTNTLVNVEPPKEALNVGLKNDDTAQFFGNKRIVG